MTPAEKHVPTPAVMALAHPIRRGVISCIGRGIDTPSDIAEKIDEPLGVTAYHVRMLRDYGVIEVTRTEPRRGALQHFYAFTATAREDFEQAKTLAANAVKSARRVEAGS